MLLRRITQHVKEQNWFAVFLDFLIVVVGVFIGLQVANWNEARADRGLRAGYLVQLIEDLQADVIEAKETRASGLGSCWRNRRYFRGCEYGKAFT